MRTHRARVSETENINRDASTVFLCEDASTRLYSLSILQQQCFVLRYMADKNLTYSSFLQNMKKRGNSVKTEPDVSVTEGNEFRFWMVSRALFKAARKTTDHQNGQTESTKP